MCGVLVVVGGGAGGPPPLAAQERLGRRGPDAHVQRGDAHVAVSVWVLRMRSKVSAAAVMAVAFNGEVFEGEGVGEEEAIAPRFAASSGVVDPEAWLARLDGLNAEWALCFHDRTSRTVWFARDRFGRRSLLLGRSVQVDSAACSTASTPTILSSVAWSEPDTITWSEVPVDGLYALSVGSDGGSIVRAAARSVRVIPPPPSHAAVAGLAGAFAERLTRAIGVRIARHTLTGGDARGTFAILFSGGIDSVVLASLAHEAMENDHDQGEICLVNVSFRGDEAHDRLAARQALEELRAAHPTRLFTLVEVNPSREEILQDEHEILAHIFPKTSVMDFNISCVFWMAAKHAPPHARALLSGIGADELLGGYKRHKTALARGGMDAYREELGLDLDRLWDRNLGRDDRVVAAHAKELRMPFLDSQVVDFVLRQGRGGEDKWLLRTLARDRGLVHSAAREKRAAQFGSKMASTTKQRGSGRDAYVCASSGSGRGSGSASGT